MVTGAAPRRDIDDDYDVRGSTDSRDTPEIMSTIRDILTRDSFVDSVDYPSPDSSMNNNDESLILEMEAQLRSEVDEELASLSPPVSVVSPITSPPPPFSSLTSPPPRSSPPPSSFSSSSSTPSSLSDYIPSPPSSSSSKKLSGTTLLSEVSPTVTPELVASALLSEHSGDIRSYLERSLEPIARRWLSDNLPTLADRVVRSEVERFARSRT